MPKDYFQEFQDLDLTRDANKLSDDRFRQSELPGRDGEGGASAGSGKILAAASSGDMLDEAVAKLIRWDGLSIIWDRLISEATTGFNRVVRKNAFGTVHDVRNAPQSLFRAVPRGEGNELALAYLFTLSNDNGEGLKDRFLGGVDTLSRFIQAGSREGGIKLREAARTLDFRNLVSGLHEHGYLHAGGERSVLEITGTMTLGQITSALERSSGDAYYQLNTGNHELVVAKKTIAGQPRYFFYDPNFAEVSLQGATQADSALVLKKVIKSHLDQKSKDRNWYGTLADFYGVRKNDRAKITFDVYHLNQARLNGKQAFVDFENLLSSDAYRTERDRLVDVGNVTVEGVTIDGERITSALDLSSAGIQAKMPENNFQDFRDLTRYANEYASKLGKNARLQYLIRVFNQDTIDSGIGSLLDKINATLVDATINWDDSASGGETREHVTTKLMLELHEVFSMKKDGSIASREEFQNVVSKLTNRQLGAVDTTDQVISDLQTAYSQFKDKFESLTSSVEILEEAVAKLIRRDGLSIRWDRLVYEGTTGFYRVVRKNAFGTVHHVRDAPQSLFRAVPRGEGNELALAYLFTLSNDNGEGLKDRFLSGVDTLSLLIQAARSREGRVQLREVARTLDFCNLVSGLHEHGYLHAGGERSVLDITGTMTLGQITSALERSSGDAYYQLNTGNHELVVAKKTIAGQPRYFFYDPNLAEVSLQGATQADSALVLKNVIKSHLDQKSEYGNWDGTLADFYGVKKDDRAKITFDVYHLNQARLNGKQAFVDFESLLTSDDLDFESLLSSDAYRTERDRLVDVGNVTVEGVTIDGERITSALDLSSAGIQAKMPENNFQDFRDLTRYANEYASKLGKNARLQYLIRVFNQDTIDSGIGSLLDKINATLVDATINWDDSASGGETREHVTTKLMLELHEVFSMKKDGSIASREEFQNVVSKLTNRQLGAVDTTDQVISDLQTAYSQFKDKFESLTSSVEILEEAVAKLIRRDGLSIRWDRLVYEGTTGFYRVVRKNAFGTVHHVRDAPQSLFRAVPRGEGNELALAYLFTLSNDNGEGLKDRFLSGVDTLSLLIQAARSREGRVQLREVARTLDFCNLVSGLHEHGYLHAGGERSVLDITGTMTLGQITSALERSSGDAYYQLNTGNHELVVAKKTIAGQPRYFFYDPNLAEVSLQGATQADSALVLKNVIKSHLDQKSEYGNWDGTLADFYGVKKDDRAKITFDVYHLNQARLNGKQAFVDFESLLTSDDLDFESLLTSGDLDVESLLTSDDSDSESLLTSDDSDSESLLTSDDSDSESLLTSDDLDSESLLTSDDYRTERDRLVDVGNGTVEGATIDGERITSALDLSDAEIQAKMPENNFQDFRDLTRYANKYANKLSDDRFRQSELPGRDGEGGASAGSVEILAAEIEELIRWDKLSIRWDGLISEATTGFNRVVRKNAFGTVHDVRDAPQSLFRAVPRGEGNELALAYLFTLSNDNGEGLKDRFLNGVDTLSRLIQEQSPDGWIELREAARTLDFRDLVSGLHEHGYLHAEHGYLHAGGEWGVLDIPVIMTLDQITSALERSSGDAYYQLNTGNHALVVAKKTIAGQPRYFFYDPNLAEVSLQGATQADSALALKKVIKSHLDQKSKYGNWDGTLADFYGVRKDDSGKITFDVYHLNQARLNGKQAFVDFENLLSSDAYRTERDRLVDVGNVTVEGVTLSAVELYDLGATIDGERITSALDLSSAEIQAKLKFSPKYLGKRLVGVNSASASDTQMQRNVQLLRKLIDREGGDTRKLLFGPGNSQDKDLALKALDSVKKFIASDLSINPRLWSHLQGIQLTSRTGLRLFKASQGIRRLASPGFLRRNKSSEITAEDQKQQANAFGRDGEFDLVRHAPVDVGNVTVEGATIDGERITGDGERITSALDLSAKMPENNLQDSRDLTRDANKLSDDRFRQSELPGRDGEGGVSAGRAEILAAEIKELIRRDRLRVRWDRLISEATTGFNRVVRKNAFGTVHDVRDAPQSLFRAVPRGEGNELALAYLFTLSNDNGEGLKDRFLGGVDTLSRFIQAGSRVGWITPREAVQTLDFRNLVSGLHEHGYAYAGGERSVLEITGTMTLGQITSALERSPGDAYYQLNTGNHTLVVAKKTIAGQPRYFFYDPNLAEVSLQGATQADSALALKKVIKSHLDQKSEYRNWNGTLADFYGVRKADSGKNFPWQPQKNRFVVRKDDSGKITFDVYHLNQARLNGKQAFVDFENLLSSDAYRTERDRLVDVGNVTVEGVTLSAVELYDLGATIDGERITSALDLSSAEIQAKLKFLPKYLGKRLVGVNTASDTQMQRNVQLLRKLIDREGGDTRKLLFGAGNSRDKYLALKALNSVKKFVASDLSINPRLWSHLQGIQLTSRTGLRLFKASQRIGRLASPGFLRRNKNSEITAEDQKQQANAFGRDGEFDLVRHAPVDVGNGTVEDATIDGERITGDGERITSALDLSAKMPENNLQDSRDLTRDANKLSDDRFRQSELPGRDGEGGASAGSGDMLAAEIEELIRWDKLRVRWDGLVSEATTGFNRVVRKNAFGTVHHVHDAPQSLFRAVPRGEGNELALAYLFTLSNDNGEGLKDRFLNGVDTLSRLIQARSREGWIELREAVQTLDFRDLVSGLHEHGYLHAEHGYLHAGGEWGVLDIPVIMTLDQITSALERSSGDAYYQLNTGNHELVVAKKTIAGQPRYFFYDPNLAEVSLQGATQAVSALALKKVIKSHLDQKSKDGNWDGTLADFYGVRKDDSAEITFDVYHLNQARLNGKQAFVDFENLLSSDAYRTERDRLVDVGNVTVEGVTLSAVELYDLGATIDGERITSALDLSSAEIQAKLKFLPKYLGKRLVGVNSASASDTQMQRNVQLLRKLIDREGGDTRKLLFGPGNSQDKDLALKALDSVKKFIASDLSINSRLWSHLQGIQPTSRTGLRLFKASQRIGRLASPGFLRRNKSSEITAEDQKQQANAFGRDGEFDLVRHAPVDVGNGTVEDATIDGERITSALDLSDAEIQAKMPENNLQDSRDLTRDANKLSDDRFRQSDLPGLDGEGGVSAGRAEILAAEIKELIRWDRLSIRWDGLVSEATTGFNRVVRKNAFGTVHDVRNAPQSLFRAVPRGEGNELALAYLFTLSNDNGEGLKDRFLNGVDTFSQLIQARTQARSREGWMSPREAAQTLDFRNLVSGLHEHGYAYAGSERSVLEITGTMTLGQITSALERSSGDAYYQLNTGNHELVVAKKTIAGQPRYFFYDPNLAEVSLQGATQADSALALKKVIKSHLDQKSEYRNWNGTLADFYGVRKADSGKNFPWQPQKNRFVVRKDDSGKITFDVYHLNQARLNGKQAFVDFENLLSSDAYRTERDRLVDVGNVTVEGVTLSAVELYDLGATIDGERITSALDLSSAEIQAKLKFLPKYLVKRLVGVNSASASDTQMQRNVQLLRKLIDREGGDTRKLLFGAGNSRDKYLALKALNSVKKFVSASDLSINPRLWSHLQGIQLTSRTGLRLFKASQRIGRLASPGFLRRNNSSEITAEDQKQQANAFGRGGEFDLVRHAPVDVGNGTVEDATIDGERITGDGERITGDGERITGDGERITSALDLSAKMPENNFQDSRDLTRYASKLGENPSLQLLINKFNQDTIDSGVGSLLAEIDEIDDTLADLDDITWVERRRTVTAELMLELHEVFRIKDDGSIASREEFQNVVRQLRAVDAPDQVISDLQTAYNQFKENFESLITSDAWLLLADQGRTDDRFRQSELPDPDGEGGASAGSGKILAAASSGDMLDEAVAKLIRWDGLSIIWDRLISEATTGFNRVVRKNAFGTVHDVRNAPQSLFRAVPRGEGNELALAYLFTLSNDNGEGLKDRFLGGVDTLSRFIQAGSRVGWITPREAVQTLDFRNLVSGLHEHGYAYAGGERSVLDITGTMTLGQITSALERSSGDAYYQLNTGNHELVVAKKTIAGQPRYFFYDPNFAEVSLQGATQADSALVLKDVIKSHLDQKSKYGNWDGTLADFYGVRKADSGKNFPWQRQKNRFVVRKDDSAEITFDVYHLNQARLNGKQAFVDFENLLSSDAYRTERDRLVDVGNVTVEGVTLSAVELYDLGATIDGERITSALDLSSAEIQAKLKFLPKYLVKRLVGVNSASASDTQMQRNVQLLRKLIDRDGGDTRKLLFGAGNSQDKDLALKALDSVKKFIASDLSINSRLWSKLQGIQPTSRTGLRLFKASQRIGRLASPGFLRRNKSSEITAEDQKQQANAFGRDGEFDLVRHAPVDVGNVTVEGATIDGERITGDGERITGNGERITSALDLSSAGIQAKMPENNLQDSRDLTRDANKYATKLKLSDDRFRQSKLPGRDGEGRAILAAEKLIRRDKLSVRWDRLVYEGTTGFNRVVRKNAFGTVHHVRNAPQSLFRTVPRGEGNELALAYLFTLAVDNDNGEGLKNRFLGGVDRLSQYIQARSRVEWISPREAVRPLDFYNLVSGLHEHGYLHAGGERSVLDTMGTMTLGQITFALEGSSGDVYYQLNTGNHELVVAKKTIAGQPRYFFYDPNFAEVSLQGATQTDSALALKNVIKSHLDQKSKDGNWYGTLADFYGVRKDDSAEITFDVYHLNQARLNGKQAFVDFENLLSSDAYRTERDRLVDVGNVTVEGVTLSAVELYDLGATIDGERITSALDLSSAEIQAKLKFSPKYLGKRLVGVNTASDTQMQRNVQLLRKLIDREGGDTRKLLFGAGNSRDKYLALKALNSVKKFVSASDLSINPRLWSHLQGIQPTSRTGLRLFKASQRIGRLASPGFLRRNKSSEITAEDQKQQANAFGRDGEFDLVRHAPVDVGNGTVEGATRDGERITGNGERITSALDLSSAGIQAKMPENNFQDFRDLTRYANKYATKLKLSDDRFRQSKLPGRFRPSKLPGRFRPSKLPGRFRPSKLPGRFRQSKLPDWFRQSKLPGRDGEGRAILAATIEKLIRRDGLSIRWDRLISEATTGFNRVVRKNAFGTVHHVHDAPQSLFRAVPRGEGNELALAYLFTLSNDNGEGLKDRFLNGVDTLSRLIQEQSREGGIELREAAQTLDFRNLVSGLHEHGYAYAGGERSVLDIPVIMTLDQITSALERSSGDAYYQLNTGNHELVVAKKTIAGQPRYFFYDPNLAEVSLQGATQADSALALKNVIKSHLDQKSKYGNWDGTLADFYGVRKDDSGKITFDVYHLNQARLNGKQAFVDFENLLSSDAYRTERDRLVDVGNVTVEGVTLSAVELYDLGATIDGKRITGDGKRITGDGEQITGDGERITGDGERITGDGERITGDGKRITGDGERITGDGERITGDGERITGDGERITGDGERITGDDDRITGDGERITGDGERITSARWRADNWR